MEYGDEEEEEDKFGEENKSDYNARRQARTSTMPRIELDCIEEEESSFDPHQSGTKHFSSTPKNIRNKHMGDAMQMLDKINQLSRPAGNHSRMNSTINLGTGG